MPQYEEEFSRLFVLTLARLKQVDSLSLQSCLVIVTLRAVSCQPAKLMHDAHVSVQVTLSGVLV